MPGELADNEVVIDKIRLHNIEGENKYLADEDTKEFLVVIFLGTECPLAKLYSPRLAELSKLYAAKPVAFFGIDANSQDSLAEINAYTQDHKLPFPVYKDSEGQLAMTLGAERTPEVYVLDRNRKIRYQGRIDDQYGVGYQREAASRDDLKIALDELLAGKAVSHPRTTATGCFIGRIREPKTDSTVNYHHQIAPILKRYCTECHRKGDIAPFALTQYEDVASWSETMEEVIRDGRMPPWHANPEHGKFSNARVMTDQEKSLVYQWVAAGAPQGDPQQLLPEAVDVADWRLSRPPDQVVSMRALPFTVPAEGTVEYQYFIVDPGFTEEKWVTAAEVKPGNRSVVHHAIVFISPPERDQLAGFGWLAAYVPGQRSVVLDKGQARRIPAGSRLIFQMHYTPTGSNQEDRTRIGLIFTDSENVHEEVITLMAINREFEIPPGDPNYRVETSLHDLPEGGRLSAIVPHMHLRGKSFRMTLQNKDQREVLLDVPRYDFNWQHVYQLEKPLVLSQQMRIKCVAHYDNSAANRVNPDPSATVHWGDQSWDEMMLAFFQIAITRREAKPVQATEVATRSKRLLQAKKVAAEWIVKLDQNGDGQVQRAEAPESFRRFAFDDFDRDNDNTISREEAIASTEKTLGQEIREQDPKLRYPRLQ